MCDARLLAVAGLLIPRLPRPALKMAVAIVGAGIMPANFYLHSALVHSRSASSTCDLQITSKSLVLNQPACLHHIGRKFFNNLLYCSGRLWFFGFITRIHGKLCCIF